MGLREKFSLVKKIIKLSIALREEKRLKKVFMDLVDKKVNEIYDLERQLDLIWELYGIDYKKRIDGLAGLLEDVRDGTLHR